MSSLNKSAVYTLSELIDYRDHQISSRSLDRKFNMGLPMVLYALDAGESISRELTDKMKFMQIIDGVLQVDIAGEKHVLKQGEVIIVAAGTPHEIHATERCKFLQIETDELKG